MTRQQAISRQCGLGVSHLAIAAEFNMSVRDVQRIDNRERARRAARRTAEPLPGLRELDWRSARPAEDRIRRGEACRFPECMSTVFKGSYCEAHGKLVYRPRVAA